ncbi:hypothetical protein [Anaerorhabdus sp.]|uniref:hypothetical protein n=1 Tax=Anaerorhabdus sp. TaxID=1872524 RepID=UPI002FCA3F21
MGKKVQIVSQLQYNDSDLVENTRFGSSNSFNDYEINIISTLGENVWKAKEYYTDSYEKTYFYDDFNTLSRSVKASKNYTVLILPQNYNYAYNMQSDKLRIKYTLLKNTPVTIFSMIEQVAELSRGKNFLLIHGKTNTAICGDVFESDFTFSSIADDWSNITISIGSEATTIQRDKLILTTLNLDTTGKIELFLKHIGLLEEEKETEPEWIGGYVMFDDDKQNEIIALSEQKIKDENALILEAEQKLSENKRFKSILYTTGDELVEVVNEIMTDMFGADLSKFVDKRKEDFEFACKGKVIIGEIKGISSYVKRTNLSQLDAHFSSYIENHEGINENDIKKILIINPRRQVPINERDAIDPSLIQVAERNYGQLIIETIDLLKLYEDFKDGRITQEECINILINQLGQYKHTSRK